METIKSISSFVSACNARKPDDTAGFAILLHWAVTNLAIHQRDLAGEFEVSPASISRWASGASSPHPRIQAFIISSLRKRASKQLNVPTKAARNAEARPVE